MKTLKNRKIDFRFDDDIPFDWNPGNTGVGNVVNYASMIAPAFEKYFIRVTRQALPMIKSPEVLANAKEFCAQEGTHARHHNAHMGMLIRKYSGLEAAQKKVAASYDRIFEERNLEFHAAYMINLEHVPIEDNPTRASLSGLVDGVSWHYRLKFLARMLAALAPSYEPADLQEPEWVTQWFRDEEDGQDMSCYFPRSGPAPANPSSVGA
jgi:hypothetical protein